MQNKVVLTNIGKLLGERGIKLVSRLSREGFFVVRASTDDELLAAARQKVPDLVLLSLPTTDCDTYAFCLTIKNDPWLSSIPVVFIGKKETDSALTKSFDVGAVDFVSMSLNQRELIARLRAHMKMHRTTAVPTNEMEFLELKSLLSALPITIIEIDRDGKIINYNEPQKGAPLLEVQINPGMTLSEILPSDTVPMLLETVQQVIDTGQAAVCRSYILPVDGEIGAAKWLEFTVSRNPVSNSGCLFVVIYDVTHYLRVEQAKSSLEQTVREKEKMQAIRQLAGGLVNDINNLLSAIMSFASCLQVDLGRSSGAPEEISKIIQACRKGYEITSKLASMSERVSLEKVQLSLDSLLGEVQELVSKMLPEHVEVKTNCEPEIADTIGDPVLLNHVLMNLMFNSIDAVREKGTITLSARNFFPEMEDAGLFQDIPSGRYVLIQVTDDGAGMRPEVKKRVFEPFFTTKPLGLGAGLGLSVVLGVVKSHGGSVAIESEFGSGTRVSLLLPAAVSDQDLLVTEKAEKTFPPKTHKILVVDDDEIVLYANRSLLKKLGYSVVVARDGLEALDIYQEQQDELSLVLLDLIMPGMDGYETFNKLKNMDPEVKIILCTGYYDEEKANELIQQGAMGILLKPFEVHDLLEQIENALDEQAP